MAWRIPLHVFVRKGIGDDVSKGQKDVGSDRGIGIFVDRHSSGCMGDIDITDAVFNSGMCDDVLDRGRDVDKFIFALSLNI